MDIILVMALHKQVVGSIVGKEGDGELVTGSCVKSGGKTILLG